MCVLSNLCELYIFLKPLLQVHKKSVRYHGRYTESQLEGLVEEGVYPPSIKCAVLYSSPRDFGRPSLETFDMTIAGITKHHVSFPIKVYSAIGESKCRSMRHLCRQDSLICAGKLFPVVCHAQQRSIPYCIMFLLTAAATPTPFTTQTEATSKPHPSLSLWEAARKWAM